MTTRERILAAAIELFARDGYDKTGIRQLGAHLDMTSASLYYHFRNKEEILAALADDMCVKIERLNATKPKQVLADYLDLVCANKRTMAVLESSRTAIRTLDVAERMFLAMDRLASAVAPPENRIRAIAALGMLTTMPVRVPESAKSPGKEQLLKAAVAAVG